MDIQKLMALASRIDELDYYQLLGLQRNANSGDIRVAYHRRARTLHPDLFFESTDEQLKVAIDRVYKRVTEAYLVLRDDDKRAYYNEGLTVPQKRLRYTDEDEKRLRENKVAAGGTTPQGRKLYQEAERLYQSGDRVKAIQTLRMASTFESKNVFFQKRLREWESAK